MDEKLVENFPNTAEIKESNLDFKFNSGHLEQMSSLFKEIFAQPHEIKPIIMFQYIHSNSANMAESYNINVPRGINVVDDEHYKNKE